VRHERGAERFLALQRKVPGGLRKKPTQRQAFAGVPRESGYGYSQAVKVDDTIYVSGQVDHDETGKILNPGDMEGQMRQAYANVGRVLAHFGATMENVVDEILFVVDMESAMKARGRLKDEVFGQSILPAATIVQIERLALTGFMVEIRIVARV
jgi:2-iminobutanoate/2-iminopropanoate deaminase